MSEKMLVTQALDEKNLLEKKIIDKIKKASFVDYRKRNEEKVFVSRVSKEEYQKRAESAYQQIMDLVTRYQRINEAIVESNAVTYVDTSFGRYLVASAIAMRNRLKSTGSEKDVNFETILMKKMAGEYQDTIVAVENKNRQLQGTAENMQLSILGKDTKTKDDKPLAVVEAYVNENTTELVDPLDVRAKLIALKDKHDTLLKELETQIKVSNATHFIAI